MKTYKKIKASSKISEYEKDENTGVVEIIEDGKKIAEFIPIDVAKKQANASSVA